MQWTTIFPSPVGELHFSITTPIFKLNKKGNIFRPLSGNYISQLLMGLQSRRIGHIFSVPCRGTTFLNLTRILLSIWVLRISVPCRGTTFLNTSGVTGVSFHSGFPSPVGELHFSIGK